MNNEKNKQRKQGYEARRQQQDKDIISNNISQRFMAQTEYKKADSVMWYLHCRSEVRTIATLEKVLLDCDKQVVIPYCCKDDFGKPKLGLWLLEDLSELTAGCWGILEPPNSRWGEQGKEIAPEQLDLIMVPGVVFDRSGGRIGNGVGYYDRLLKNVRTDAVLTGVCFESQLVPQVITQDHDIYLDYVITEQSKYSGRGRV